MRIKTAAKGDLDALCAIEAEAFNEDSFALTRQNFLYHIAKNRLFICKIGNKTAGYILLLLRKNSKKARVYSIAVKKEFGSQGVGFALLEKSFTYAKSIDKKGIKLEVNITNTRAIGLYEKSGFVKKGIISNYYPNGADAMLMEKIF
ncbi:MAG: ribosomal protein S18-alanine N-acetyltransferase [Campylobacteraceae bacterium]|jgi:ribosomal-protein-alanine N-acetyltransferase|nr:ribosomal protein S18-alanine N-acetyltransferase [Campylobacteraceae bacterium]